MLLTAVTEPLGAVAALTASLRSARPMPTTNPTPTVALADAPPAERTEADAPPDTRRSVRNAIGDAFGVAAVTVGLVVVTLRLWEANLRVPFVYNARNEPPLSYGPDAPYYLMLTKGLVEHGSYLRIPNLGWPFSLQLYDNPETGDNLQLALLRGLGFVLRDAVLTVNVYYLLTFVGVSLAAWFVLRRLGVSRLVAAVIAILYSFVPYHFARGEAHLLLSGYFMIPIATLLILNVLSDDPPFTAPRDSFDSRWRLSLWSRRALPWLLACAAVGSTGPYYAFFAVLLLAAAVALDLVARRNLRRAASGAVAIGTILVVLVLNLSPSLLYWQSHGRNKQAIPRGILDTEYLGLRVSQLVLPRHDHRIGTLADVQARSDRLSPVPSEGGQQLGIVGALGFVGVLVFSLSRLLRRRRADDPARSPPSLGTRKEIVQRLGVLTVVAVVVATVSGFSLLIASLGLRFIRSYNRMSVFIAFFALVAVAFALDWFIGRLPRWRGRAVLAGVVCLAVLAVGVVDQTSSADVPDYRALERAWDSDDAFMHRIETELGSGAAVFQLPYVFFPEAGAIVGTGPYDQVRGWLHADSLRWSWGAVRGRDGDWMGALVRLDVTDGLDAMTAVGFSGLMIDRAGYEDNGALIQLAYSSTLGQEPLVSADGRLLFYDLRPWAEGLRERLSPAQIEELRGKTLAARAAPPGALN
jgi:phosphoglycerol transferase